MNSSAGFIHKLTLIALCVRLLLIPSLAVSAPQETAATQQDPIVIVPGDYGLDASLHKLTNIYSRQETRLSYGGPLTLEVASHVISIDKLERYTSRATEALIAISRDLAEVARLAAKVGYFSPADHHWFGDLSVQIALPADFSVGGGGYARPMILSMPLVEAEQDLMRQAGFLTWAWSEHILWRSEFRRERNAAPHELHTLVARRTLWLGKWRGDAVHLKVPMSLETHPKPSPDYQTYPRTRTIGMAVDVTRTIADEWRFDLTSMYTMKSRQLRGTNAGTSQTSAFGVDAKLAYQVHPEVLLSGRMHYEQHPQRMPVDNPEIMNFVGIGIEISPRSN